MSTKRAPTIAVALSLAAAVLCGLSGSVPALARHDGTHPAAPAADRISPETRLSLFSFPVDDERYQPALVYNGRRDEYLVVWHRDRASGGRDIVARRVTRYGELKSWFVVSTGTGDRAQPAVAFNWDEDEYLVVWMHDVSGAGGRWEIWGKIIPWDGPGTNPELAISDYLTLSSEEPSVDWDVYDGKYVVIWNNFSVELQKTPTSVAGRQVNGDGTITEAMFDVTADRFPHQSDISHDHFIRPLESTTLVVWVTVSAPSPGGTGNDVWGSLLTHAGDGSLVVGTPFSIAHSSKHETRPALSTDQWNRYIVAFEYEYSDGDRDIYGQVIDSDGNKVGLSPFQIASSNKDETHPDVVASFLTLPDPEYFAAWQRTEGTAPDTYESIMAKHWGGGVTDYTFQVTPWAWDNWTPAVATDWWEYGSGLGHLIAYAGKPFFTTHGPEASLKRHIYGRMWWPAVVYVPLVLKGD